MKDAFKRRLKQERNITTPLPNIVTNLVVYPTHQERLACTGGIIGAVSVQGNEFIATSNYNWGLATYSCETNEDEGDLIGESDSSGSNFSDEALVPIRVKTPFFLASESNDQPNEVSFITKDVVVCVKPEKSGNVSTWNVRTKELLESVSVRGATFAMAICKLSETQFVVGSNEGHIIFFSHNHGFELMERRRITKSHFKAVMAIAYHKSIIVSASFDWTAIVWDNSNNECKRLTVLPHNGAVFSVAVSDRYILTCSRCFEDGQEVRALRIFKNCEGYPLINVLLRNVCAKPAFLHNGLATYWTLDSDHGSGGGLVFFEVETQCDVAKLKLGCCHVLDYAFLDDGRVVAVGFGGSRGVIATPSDYIRSLITPVRAEIEVEQKARFCSIM